ncbi:hypothetical protein H0H93_006574 [Arthromyces matolae]|nr:hypothetical protein H0H93_006574 [Arthromyces matolae]
MEPLPYDVFESILYFLADDTETLAQCSLLCKDSVRVARSHLFSTFVIKFPQRYGQTESLVANSAIFLPHVRHLKVMTCSTPNVAQAFVGLMVAFGATNMIQTLSTFVCTHPTTSWVPSFQSLNAFLPIITTSSFQNLNLVINNNPILFNQALNMKTSPLFLPAYPSRIIESQCVVKHEPILNLCLEGDVNIHLLLQVLSSPGGLLESLKLQSIFVPDFTRRVCPGALLTLMLHAQEELQMVLLDASAAFFRLRMFKAFFVLTPLAYVRMSQGPTTSHLRSFTSIQTLGFVFDTQTVAHPLLNACDLLRVIPLPPSVKTLVLFFIRSDDEIHYPVHSMLPECDVRLSDYLAAHKNIKDLVIEVLYPNHTGLHRHHIPWRLPKLLDTGKLYYTHTVRWFVSREQRATVLTSAFTLCRLRLSYYHRRSQHA